MDATLNRETLSDQVARSLQSYVERHGLRPGDELPSEVSLAKQLGVSRAVVREAFRVLAATGFLAVSSGRRPRVGALTHQGLSRVISQALATQVVTEPQVLELRKAVEVGASELAAIRRTEQDATDLRRTLAEMEVALETPEVYVERDLAFHLVIARATQNPLYTVFLEALRQPIEGSIRTGLHSRRSKVELFRIQALHGMIADAICRGDAPAAARAMAQHFDEAVQAIVAAQD